MVKYIGSKRLLLNAIQNAISSCYNDGPGTFLDLFSGTSRVGHAMKGQGWRVLANDHNAYAATLARCYVQADREDVLEDATRLIRELNALPGRPGYFTETSGLQALCGGADRYLQPGRPEGVACEPPAEPGASLCGGPERAVE